MNTTKQIRKWKTWKNNICTIMKKERFPEANDEIIRAFGNDSRFELYFIGAGSETLEKYLYEYNNLHLIGKYEPEETAKYLDLLDTINSYFGTKVLGYEKMSSKHKLSFDE